MTCGMTCSLEDRLKCQTQRCRVLACVEYHKRAKPRQTDAEICRHLAKKLNKKKCHDFIGQLRRGKKQRIRSKALAALAEILRTRIEYLSLIDDDHDLQRVRPHLTSDPQWAQLHQPPADRDIIEQEESRERARREMEEEARKPDFEARRNIPQYVPVDLDDPDTAYYDPSLEADQDPGPYEDIEPPVLPKQMPAAFVAKYLTNPFSETARDDQLRESRSRKISIFKTRIENGVWIARTADRTTERHSLIKRSEKHPVYGFVCPQSDLLPWPFSGADIFLQHGTPLQAGGLIMTFQPLNEHPDDMFYEAGREYTNADGELLKQSIRSNLGATELRLGVWRYVGQHKHWNSLRVAKLDAHDDDEHVIIYDQCWFAVICAIFPLQR